MFVENTFSEEIANMWNLIYSNCFIDQNGNLIQNVYVPAFSTRIKSIHRFELSNRCTSTYKRTSHFAIGYHFGQQQQQPNKSFCMQK